MLRTAGKLSRPIGWTLRVELVSPCGMENDSLKSGL
jgi:hypothetical protein